MIKRFFFLFRHKAPEQAQEIAPGLPPQRAGKRSVRRATGGREHARRLAWRRNGKRGRRRA